ncbi:MAG: hypothetical protein V3U06_07815 [Candidatus Binatia bacterium]
MVDQDVGRVLVVDTNRSEIPGRSKAPLNFHEAGPFLKGQRSLE